MFGFQLVGGRCTVMQGSPYLLGCRYGLLEIPGLVSRQLKVMQTDLCLYLRHVSAGGACNRSQVYMVEKEGCKVEMSGFRA